MTVRLAPAARQQFFDANGDPYSGAKLFTYQAGTTTKQATYTTSSGVTANTNPIILDTSGRTPYGVWLTQGLEYKFVLAPSTDTDPPTSPLFTEDDISGVNDSAIALSQWAPSGIDVSYVSAYVFSMAGDQTVAFHLGRRCRYFATGGTGYGTITDSTYALGVTTVTLKTTLLPPYLDSGLSSVDLSIITQDNTGLPTRLGGRMMHIQDQKAAGTAGGASTAGGVVRTLNTVVYNNIPDASLDTGTNTITLPYGYYRIWASAPCNQGDGHRIRFYDTVSGANSVLGSSENAPSATAGSQTSSRIEGARITPTASMTFRLAHYIETAKATDGYGMAVNLGGFAEVYANVVIVQEE